MRWEKCVRNEPWCAQPENVADDLWRDSVSAVLIRPRLQEDPAVQITP